MNANSLTLRITHPDGSTRESRIEQESIILGSGSNAQLRLPDLKVSNQHLMLKVANNVITAIDLASEHGTTLREMRILSPVSLTPGDVLRLGQSSVEVVVVQQAARSPVGELPNLVFPRMAPAAPHAPLPHAVMARMSAPPGLSSRSVQGSAAFKLQPRSEPARPAIATAKSMSSPEEKAWRLLAGPLPKDAEPTEAAHVLQASMVWHDQILAVEHLAEGVPVTLGSDSSNVFPLEAAGLGRRFELGSNTGRRLQLKLPREAEVTLYRNDSTVSWAALQEAGRVSRSPAGQLAVEVSLHERARVRIGALSFLLRFVKPAPEVSVRKQMDRDTALFLSMLGASSLLAILGGVWLYLRPPHALTGAENLQNQAQYVRMIMKPAPRAPVKASPLDKKPGASEGELAKNDEGRMGKPEAKKLEADPSKSGAPKPDKRAQDLKRVRNAGLLGALAKGDAASSVFGPGGLGSGINHALGGLKAGAGAGDARGVGGFGARGTGVGGGGLGLTAGGLGTKGMGSGRQH